MNSFFGSSEIVEILCSAYPVVKDIKTVNDKEYAHSKHCHSSEYLFGIEYHYNAQYGDDYGKNYSGNIPLLVIAVLESVNKRSRTLTGNNYSDDYKGTAAYFSGLSLC